MKRYMARVDAELELLVWVREDDEGEQEIEDILEINKIIDFDNVREPY
jgi:hypothetical protein